MKKSNSVCIVGKGSSLLCKKLGALIDSHEIVIRINHLPEHSNAKQIGTKTDILSTRCPLKLKILLANEAYKNNTVWICSEYINKYKQNNNLKFISEHEFEAISQLFPNYMNLKLHRNDKKRGFFMPDTGVTSLVLTKLRFFDSVVSVCGFDLYKEGNTNIYETKSNSSIFLTPALQQLLVYKHLIKTNAIRELE